MKLYVQRKQECTYAKHSEEIYGDWEEHYNFEVRGVSLTERKSSEEFNVPFKIKAGQPVFVLFMIYDSGDSFGYSKGKGEVLWVFKYSDIALKALNKWKNSHKDDTSVEFEIDGGIKKRLSNPASGYFENLENVELETFLVNP